MSSKEFQGSRRFSEFESNKIRENFDWAEVVKRQIERCLISNSYTDVSFTGAVEGLESLLPDDMKDEMYNQDLEVAQNEKTTFTYQTYCGQRQGTKEDPKVWNIHHTDLGLSSEEGFSVDRMEDGEVDWGDPRIISPAMSIKDEINWVARFYAVFNQFVRLGIAARRNIRG